MSSCQATFGSPRSIFFLARAWRAAWHVNEGQHSLTKPEGRRVHGKPQSKRCRNTCGSRRSIMKNRRLDVRKIKRKFVEKNCLVNAQESFEKRIKSQNRQLGELLLSTIVPLIEKHFQATL